MEAVNYADTDTGVLVLLVVLALGCGIPLIGFLIGELWVAKAEREYKDRHR